jgi:hypothetical protein
VVENDQAELHRELDRFVARMEKALPRPPRWMDSKAVQKFIFAILDIWDFEEANRRAIDDNDSHVVLARRKPPRTTPQTPRGRGRPKKTQGESLSQLPDAERYCLAIMELLDRYHPKVLRRDTEAYTVQRINELLGEEVLTPEKLHNFINYRPSGDRRRFGQPRPQRKTKK